jgi:hypothetical protein
MLHEVHDRYNAHDLKPIFGNLSGARNATHSRSTGANHGLLRVWPSSKPGMHETRDVTFLLRKGEGERFCSGEWVKGNTDRISGGAPRGSKKRTTQADGLATREGERNEYGNSEGHSLAGVTVLFSRSSHADGEPRCETRSDMGGCEETPARGARAERF